MGQGKFPEWPAQFERDEYLRVPVRYPEWTGQGKYLEWVPFGCMAHRKWLQLHGGPVWWLAEDREEGTSGQCRFLMLPACPVSFLSELDSETTLLDTYPIV